MLHPGLIHFGEKARELNLLPTLTTNGSLVDTSWARAARDIFARVNVSLDLPGGPRDARATLEVTLRAVEVLAGAGITTGINIIITASNIHLLPRVFAEGRRAGADSILILRPKPSGRGRKLHKFLHPPASKQRELLPMLLELGNRYQLPFHLDCALAPLMLNSGLPMKTLKLLGGYGCIAGQLLATVDTSGLIHPCSHLDFTVGVVEDLPELWKRNELWKGFRDRASILKGKCSRCSVRELCRGGCAVFNQHNNLGFDEPDPDIACC